MACLHTQHPEGHLSRWPSGKHRCLQQERRPFWGTPLRTGKPTRATSRWIYALYLHATEPDCLDTDRNIELLNLRRRTAENVRSQIDKAFQKPGDPLINLCAFIMPRSKSLEYDSADY